ncbi:craniofacial development protein 2-like [Elysia marginata]|uniref:Craniofacial development protein 2-like n=1 Tax=Elysia marginata TaxID=1093978 RepID=A0AAV4IEE9_9GAST|nr:craniofacial development protein 2-like [Elysia marginata]
MDPFTNMSSHNARAYPVSDACQYPPTARRNRQGVLRKPRPRLKKLVEKEMRVGTWNIGTMTGKGRELVEVCKRRSLDILCVQETKVQDNWEIGTKSYIVERATIGMELA